ncbi:hypothetical protein HMPREF1139_1914 [Campylobacter sp. FOBRC14]|nr:hypothetical protein HMPREF1139_1914 [Campylobacter sp. FOBRC14]
MRTPKIKINLNYFITFVILALFGNFVVKSPEFIYELRI